MGTDNLFNGVYIVCRTTEEFAPFGSMVAPYKTKEEAEDHINYQKTVMGNKSGWSILHIQQMEWMPVKKQVQIVYSPNYSDGGPTESFSTRLISEFEATSYDEIESESEAISLKVEEQISTYVDGKLYATYSMGRKN